MPRCNGNRCAFYQNPCFGSPSDYGCASRLTPKQCDKQMKDEKILDINLDYGANNFEELLSINTILNNSNVPIIILNKYFYDNNLIDDVNKYLSNTTAISIYQKQLYR